MEEVQKIALMKALRTLQNLKGHVKYAVEFDGEVHGNATLATTKEKKRKARYPFGETRKYYMPFLEKGEVGGVVSIPFAHYDPRVLASNISAACLHLFGKGNTAMHKNEATKCIEVYIEAIEPTPRGSSTGKQLKMF